MAGIDQLDTVTNSTEPSSARRQIEALLARQGKPLNSENVSRALFANQADPSIMPNLVGAPDRMAPERGNRSAPPSVGRSAPSGSSVAKAIEDSDLPIPPVPPVEGAPTTPPTPTPTSTSTTTGSGAGGGSGSGMDTNKMIGTALMGAGGLGAAGSLGALIMRALGNRSQAMGAGPAMPPTGTIYDVPTDMAIGPSSAQPSPMPQMPGPRATPPPSAPGASPTGVASAAPDPLQSAMARAVGMPSTPPPGVGATPGVGGPRSAGALPPPGVAPPITLPDQTSGPTIPLSDATPLPTPSGVPPGPTSPTNVGRTASPAAVPRNIVNPMMDASRSRSIIDLIARNAGRVGTAARSVR
jgi:hypothetical protein